VKNRKIKTKQICSEVLVDSPGIRGVNPEEDRYGGEDLQKRKVLSLE